MFRELERIIKLIDKINHISKLDSTFGELVHTEILTHIPHGNSDYPIHAFVIGSKDKTAPTLGLFGGIHGLERVGTQVVIGFLKSLIAQMEWDKALCESLKHFRIVSIPLINPVGMKNLRRANGNGVDLMRNSPVEAIKGPKYKLYRGHRISSKLPWYRGKEGLQMESESLALIEFVKREMFLSQFSMSIDFHSGFGLRDRLWFPYASSFDAFTFKKEVDTVSSLFKNTHPHHVYKIEQQSDSYTTHGDLWDHLFFEFQKNHPQNIFIPWTLEMGSWIWLKKNPMQFFSRDGLFNPVVEHRYQRTMRRHYLLIEFFTRLIQNPTAWTNS